MQVTCQIHEPGNTVIRVSTVMTLSQWQEVCAALKATDTHWERPPARFLNEIECALVDFQHIVVRRGEEEDVREGS